jgi:Rieske 2Fe-2S family protein
MEDCRLGNRIVLDVACNWKFVHENLMDFYHVGVLHAKTFGAKFAWTDDNVHLKPGGGLSIFYAAGPPTPGAEPLLGKMPWLEDRPVSFACTGFLAPNCTLFGRIDCVRMMVAWPEGPGRSRTVIYHLFPEAFFDRPGFAETLAVYRDYQLQVLEEDRSMIESMQLAMASPAYRPGRMSTLEKPLHHYLNGYLDRVLGEGDRAPAAVPSAPPPSPRRTA